MSATEGLQIRKDIIATTLTLDSGNVEGDESPNNPTNNFQATVDPTVTDDSSVGYGVGSRWINTTSGDVFTCVDATEGAAVWSLGGSGDDSFTTLNVSDGSSGNDVSASGTYVVEKSGAGVGIGFITFTPQDSDILKIIFKSGSGSYELNVGQVYEISSTTLRPNVRVTLGQVAHIQYFGGIWYPLNSRFTVTM